MARLLHDDCHDHDRDRHDLCDDFRDDSTGRSDCSDGTGHDHTGDCSGHDHHGGHCDHDHHDDRRGRRRRRRRRDKLIPVGNISIDCRPVTFRTPGQARNVLSCASTQTVTVPVTRTVNVQVPTDFGCFLCVPVTETFQVPVETTVNVPPTLVPIPRIVCPPGVVSGISRPCGC